MATKDKESSGDTSSEEVTTPTKAQTKKPTPAAKEKGTVASTKNLTTPDAGKEESSNGSSSEEEGTKPPVVAKPVTTKPTKGNPAVSGTKATPAKKEESSDDSSSEEEGTKPPVVAKPVTTKGKQTPATKPTKAAVGKNLTAPKKGKEKSSSEDTGSDIEKPTDTKAVGKKPKKGESSGEDMIISEEKDKEKESSGSSSEMHIDLGKKGAEKGSTEKGVKRKRDGENGEDEVKKRKLNGSGGNTKVRVGNLAFTLDGKIDEIKQQFADCGEIKNVQMITRNDGRFAGVAIVEFETTEGAEAALLLHDQDFYGRNLNLSYSTDEGSNRSGGFEKKGGSRPPSEKPEGCTTVWIGNLSYDVTEDQVYEFFSDCGEIKELRWPKGDFTGIGWVEFFDTNAPDVAIAKVGQNLAGRAIRIDYAAPRKNRF